MFSDCYQMRTRTTIQHSYINSFFCCWFSLLRFFNVSWALEPCILGQRVTAPFWRLWRCPDSMARSQKRKHREKLGQWHKTGQWHNAKKMGQMVGWSVAATEAWWQRCRMFRFFIPRGGHCCKLFKWLFAKEISILMSMHDGHAMHAWTLMDIDFFRWPRCFDVSMRPRQCVGLSLEWCQSC